MSAFPAFRRLDEGGTVRGRIVTVSLDELSQGGVVIKATYSSVNYKDALAATGTGKIVCRFPLIAGIDVSGTVESSTDARFAAGDNVLVTGYDLGVAHDGGYAGRVRVPGDWVVPLPSTMTLFDAMAIGTAGFTAALFVVDMEKNGLAPDSGPVIVTGATGGVGSVAIQILASRGYQVTALTGKDAEHDYLRSLGARDVLSRNREVWRRLADDLKPPSLQTMARPIEMDALPGAFDALLGGSARGRFVVKVGES